MSGLALDTSVAIPLLVRSHAAHSEVVDWLAGRAASLPVHALAETYSVLTRLPADLRVSAEDAARLLSTRFRAPLTLAASTSAALPTVLAKAGIAGGAVYDALVALAALEHGAQLATRDARAKATYDALGVHVLVVRARSAS